MLDWASFSGSWIAEFDHNSEFPLDPRRAHALAAAAQGGSRVIYFDTFGKMLFPSLRLGYLVVPKDVVSKFHEVQRNLDSPASLPDQIVLSEFVASGQMGKHLRRCREAYVERRATIIDALEEECGDVLTVDRNQYGLCICARMAPGVDDGMAARLAGAQGIVVEPLNTFAVNEQDRGLLLGYSGYTPEALRTGVRKLAVALKQLRPT
jgi:GntR family transcriptional regulator/MocR family aminotransferase